MLIHFKVYGFWIKVTRLSCTIFEKTAVFRQLKNSRHSLGYAWPFTVANCGC